MKMKSNSGREKAPIPAHVRVFAGIKGLVASGSGTKKNPDTQKMRPEMNEGARIPSPPSTSTPKKGQSLTQKSMGTTKPHGTARVMMGARPEPAVRRDSVGVAKPF